MAANSKKATQASNDEIMANAQQTFNGFFKLLTWGGIAAFLVAMFVIFLLAR